MAVMALVAEHRWALGPNKVFYYYSRCCHITIFSQSDLNICWCFVLYELIHRVTHVELLNKHDVSTHVL